ncbi:hypothetical protein FQA47_022699 [Oryzias melastigma]|uniref:Uncharacterized protein n=1 Tax=Oryzias melastigma TaxID=30732 RepID=A0A834FAV8_ORYME|nr:hypothetical protein FQA47_022699 [Oryzias melastigma]
MQRGECRRVSVKPLCSRPTQEEEEEEECVSASVGWCNCNDSNSGRCPNIAQPIRDQQVSGEPSYWPEPPWIRLEWPRESEVSIGWPQYRDEEKFFARP